MSLKTANAAMLMETILKRVEGSNDKRNEEGTNPIYLGYLQFHVYSALPRWCSAGELPPPLHIEVTFPILLPLECHGYIAIY
jgi:hypothetical protein